MFEPRLRRRRLVVAHGMAITWLAQPWMGCNEFVLMEQLYDRISRFEPEALANQRERHGVQRLL